ncbi:hypothetical protein DK842_17095 [Chromobacterium phragmitis]|uniref:Patatin-like phospholipase family protein n=1 Tax=Chromobacterium phragmitis TaxID=2202141 RepID=A0ABV0IQI2_9NEIS|nr:hypothetical protein [Chromobacterium phragmitis]AXE31462.1 hypothetical protein DK842_17095 [Chromobacterium phragmitis]
MTAIHIRQPVLTIKAGAGARRLLQQGLSPFQVATLPGAAGGPKAVGMTGLDQAVFGWLAGAPRERELVGASIGGWRFACAMQPDPAAALSRLAERYTAEHYHPGATVAQITAQTRQMLRDILGPDGLENILAHPHYRLSLLLVQSRGLTNREARSALFSGLALAAALNAVSRPLLRHSFSRVICHDPRSSLRFRPEDAIPTRLYPLNADNLEQALMGTVAIPGVLHGVQLPGAPKAVYRDGGLTDYHIDFPFAHGDDIALYPHFTDRIVPGWFDKTLPWRKPSVAHHANTVLLAPSREYLAALPGQRLPDRKDFRRYQGRDELRRRHWKAASAESQRLGDAFLAWLEKPGSIAVQPL